MDNQLLFKVVDLLTVEVDASAAGAGKIGDSWTARQQFVGGHVADVSTGTLRCVGPDLKTAVVFGCGGGGKRGALPKPGSGRWAVHGDPPGCIHAQSGVMVAAPDLRTPL